jgi:hypothetical protein
VAGVPGDVIRFAKAWENKSLKLFGFCAMGSPVPFASIRSGSSASGSTVVSVDGSEALMTRDVLAMILIPSSRDDDPFRMCARLDASWFQYVSVHGG